MLNCRFFVLELKRLFNYKKRHLHTIQDMLIKNVGLLLFLIELWNKIVANYELIKALVLP